MTGQTCDATWGFDVDFDVTCQRTGPHDCHRAEIPGNGGTVAAVEWPIEPDRCPVCGQSRAHDPESFTYVEIRALCEPEPELVQVHDCAPSPTDRPAALPDPVIPSN